MLVDQALNPTHLNWPEAAAAVKADRAEPELGSVLVALDVNMRRFVRIARVK
jgi:hypothetical protein